METRRRQREAELVAMMLYDKAGLRSEFWRVVCNGGSNREFATVPSRELIQAILDKEYPDGYRVPLQPR
jgi:hypothetical protein